MLGTQLRVGIVHARWNTEIISSLLSGVITALRESGVKDENIVIQSVPGSFELPFAVQRYDCPPEIQFICTGCRYRLTRCFLCRMYASSQMQHAGALNSGVDILSSAAPGPSETPSEDTMSAAKTQAGSTAPFDAMIAIGCLIKGETMHFEYIADAVSHGLMKTQSDKDVPVVFGLLTVLNEEQAQARAGIGSSSKKHNHGSDWGRAAVELGVKRRAWAKGEYID